MNSLPLPSRQRQRQRGASMIEVLVAFVIFSFGMLGIAGLQTKTLSFSQSSLYRSQATALTDDILDRLRADRLGAIAGHWDTSIDEAASDVTSSGVGVVQTDLADWKSQVEALLPEGEASISVSSDPASLGVVKIIIRWDDSRGRDDPLAFETISRI